MTEFVGCCVLTTLDKGTEQTPLVIKGGRGEVISAFTGDRTLMWDQKVVDIRHSWITLEVRMSASLLDTMHTSVK